MKTHRGYPLDLLETLKVFVESPSISVAAKRLGVSQPAVSQQLKRLEGALPQPLFVFQGRKKVLSHYGGSLYQVLKDKLPDMDHALDRVNLLYAQPHDLKLRLGARREILVSLLGRLVFEGKVQVVNLSNEEILVRLRNGSLEVGITWEKPNDPNILARPLLTQTTRLCVPKSFLKKISSEKILETMDENVKAFLKTSPCVAYKEVEPPFLTACCKWAGVQVSDLNIRRVVDDWNLISKMVEAQIGWSVIPSGIELDRKKVETLEIPKTIVPEQTFYLLYSTSLRHLPAIKTLFKSESVSV